MEFTIIPSNDGSSKVRMKGCSKYQAYDLAAYMRKRGWSTTRPRYRKGLWWFSMKRRAAAR